MSRANTRNGILHHVGGGNLGDEATLETVARDIKRRWPNAEIVALSMNPDDTKARHGVKSDPLRRMHWSIGYRSARTKAIFKENMKALAQKYRAVFYPLAMVRLPSEASRELNVLRERANKELALVRKNAATELPSARNLARNADS
jgi:polysaccharide pyruvyl transferase WcaK-like protein